MVPSNSLQIPAIDSPNNGTPPGPSSRHYNNTSNSSANYNNNAGARPTSVAAPTAPAPPSSSRRQRASHTVVSPTQQQAQQHQHHHHHHGGHSSHNPSHSHRDPSSQYEDPSIPPTPSSQPYADVYSHPAAVAYAAAHPRRTIPKFGPYLLLQTLGEGEFGKVKLGLHSQWGEEVAVKLIRRGNVDSSLRMSKVEREIEVLKTLKHPNIVRLYDVIETDKYIGIILEYASGGELFDHILAHRYLREKDAAKLFSQLISGVWYIHQKKIVHRDLKLENLLLDRHRNVIITDFGFANRFEHKADDLMQTSCGSPCYAAPELVISEGLYVGSAVDIWSCGVILYAMLAGYLPFDDDPANPDGDNINLLYKYIVSTPLSFPEYISTEARDLLSMMLVPDPQRRTTLDGVMRHSWLAAYRGDERRDGVPNAFGRSVDELERAAMEQHQQKRMAYQRQMRANAQVHQGQVQQPQQQIESQNNVAAAPSPSRSQSHRPDYVVSQPPPAVRSHSTQPEYLYDSSADQTVLSSPGSQVPTVPNTPTQQQQQQQGMQGTKKMYGSPQALGLSEDDPFAGPGVNNNATNGTGLSPAPPPTSASASANAKGHKTTSSGGGGGGFRHTIQVEYDEPRGRRRSNSQSKQPGQQQQQQQQQQRQGPTTPPKESQEKERRPSQSHAHGQGQGQPRPLPPSPSSPSTATQTQTQVQQQVVPLPSVYRSPGATSAKAGELGLDGVDGPGMVNANANAGLNGWIPPVPMSAPPNAPSPSSVGPAPGAISDKDKDVPAVSSSSAMSTKEKEKESGSQNSTSSFKPSSGSGHRKGKSSVDRMGLGKIFGGLSGSGSQNGSGTTTAVNGAASASSVVLPQTPSASASVEDSAASTTTTTAVSPAETRDTATATTTNGKEAPQKKTSRRNTLTVMVEPFSRTMRGNSTKRSGSKQKMASTPISSIYPPEGNTVVETPIANAHAKMLNVPSGGGHHGHGHGHHRQHQPPHTAAVDQPTVVPATATGSSYVAAPPPSSSSTSQEFGGVPEGANGGAPGNGMQASTSKAKKVMQWFRSKSKGRESLGVGMGGGGGSGGSSGTLGGEYEEKEREMTPTPRQEGQGQGQKTPGPGQGGVLSKYRRGYSASSSTVNQAKEREKEDNNTVLVAPPVQVVVTTPTSAVGRPIPTTPSTPMQQQRTASVGTNESSAPSASASAMTPSFVARFRNSVTLGGVGRERRTSSSNSNSKHAQLPSSSSSHAPSSSSHGPSPSHHSSHPYAQLRIHHGAVDQTTITTRPPPEVMAHVRKVLEGMGVEAQMESEYKVRCVRVKKRKDVGVAMGVGQGPELAVVTMVGSAASGGVDKRGLPLPSPSSFASTGGSMLRGLLMRRQSSQVSSHHNSPAANPSSSQPSLAFDDETSVVVSEPLPMSDSAPSPLSPVPPSNLNGGAIGPAYGDPSQDAGDEVRFSVELTRIDRLNDTYSLDIRRLKGNLRSYKFLYDTLRDRADLSASQHVRV